MSHNRKLAARQTIKEFDKEAFPRFKQTQKRIQTIVSRIKGLIDKVAVNWKWTYKMDNPLIVLLYRNEPKHIDWKKLSVQASDIRETTLEMQNIADDLLPDFSMMHGIFDLTNDSLDNVLFALDQPEDSLSNTTFNDLSELIAAELRLDSKDIFHHIDTTRSKWTVDRVKKNITNYICERLGNIISKSLIQKLESDFKAADLDISQFLFDNTDISGIRQAIYEFTVRYMVEQILKGVKAVVTVVITFLFTENLNSRSFRDKIAHTVHEQITENKEGLIWSILAKFKDLQLPILQEIKGSVFEILIQTADPLECRTEMDCYYHELKIVASR
ncbi:unnamed protein product [Mytilus edulis]|uniref:Uncharacterized protein n=1 Tax=Mytilus edulis TaxID=6550 RepID=A0A8S3RX45_MYTED|nr:unnamed protein product [Mytilus edulis]